MFQTMDIFYIYFDDIHKYIENMVSYIESGIELGQHIIIIDSQPKFDQPQAARITYTCGITKHSLC